MAKITQFGRMRRKIKKEIKKASLLAAVQAAGMLASTANYIKTLQSTALMARELKAAHAVWGKGREEREEERLP